MASSRLVVLLRGINVGGHHKLPMATLRAVLEGLGGRDVRTYIQSGNAVLTAEPAGFAARVAEALEAQVGFAVPTVVRAAASFEGLAERHPFLGPAVEDRHLYVGFLSATPDPARVAKLDLDRALPDRLLVQDDVAWLAFPGGSARSRLTNDWLDRQLGVSSTWRNVLTVRALAALAAGGG